MKDLLVPVENCWVKHIETERVGRVRRRFARKDNIDLDVHWLKSNKTSLVDLSEVENGFKVGMEVQNVPSSVSRESLGEGVILRTRTIGGRDQVLVDFLQSGNQIWIPYENLRQIKGPRHRFTLGDLGPEDAAERFRLKCLAYALELWNQNTGSLSQLDIDPLPHQIYLVHHVLASGNLNWLIADDVGLGKTIEVGMLLKALQRRDSMRRVLLVTPAGITKQWQEELHSKFGLSEFEIYGEDFFVNEPRQWKMHNFVIGSLDRFKIESHLDSLMLAEPWDLVIFDEAHRLSRRQYGMKYDSSMRFDLASKLRPLTPSLLLLSATPHQGMQDKFQSLLELLRPDRRDEIATLTINPEILGEMVFRNNKADVTDADGNFVFHGKTSVTLNVPASKAAKSFDQSLQEYLKKGYAAGTAGGNKGRAIGFVMTIYRKLAASSAAAIDFSLRKRLKRLEEQALTSENYSNTDLDIDSLDSRFEGESEENRETPTSEFFKGEIASLANLIARSKALLSNDQKINLFLNEIIPQILSKNSEEKVLIFTEYRKTQEYLREHLTSAFSNSVELINGSMDLVDRRHAISRFQENSQFLISTEAGGEGINLQDNCNVMINYDLPWNPMRLVQRIGRLYRYGQKKRVFVFNLHSPETVDEQVVNLMYTRLDQVVSDLSSFGDEFNENLHDDILGQFAELIDIREILESAGSRSIERTRERIEDALARARTAVVQQKELFDYASRFDPTEKRYELAINQDHIYAFLEGILEISDLEILGKTHDNRIWKIRLSESLKDVLGLTKVRWDLTLDRVLAATRPETHMLDLDSFFMRHFLETAKSYDFQGSTAPLITNLKGQAVINFLLRWQNEEGERQRQEFTALGISQSGGVQINPPEFSAWLLERATNAVVAVDQVSNREHLALGEAAIQKRLSEVSNKYVHPQNSQLVSAGWMESNEK